MQETAKPLSSLKNSTPPPATVLCIGGHDPSGGAGLQADIESIGACGGYAVTAPSCLTVQNHREVRRVSPVDSALLIEMLNMLLESCTPTSIKIGLLANAEQIDCLADWLGSLNPLPPLVVDPVMRASDGRNFADEAFVARMHDRLLPLVTLLTPNHHEAQRLSGQNDNDAAVAALLNAGCQNVLLTGGDQGGDTVTNELQTGRGEKRNWRFPRLAGEFHGTGCTLASAAACYLAQGLDITEACERAQYFTQQSLELAFPVDGGPALPRRPRS